MSFSLKWWQHYILHILYISFIYSCSLPNCFSLQCLLNFWTVHSDNHPVYCPKCWNFKTNRWDSTCTWCQADRQPDWQTDRNRNSQRDRDRNNQTDRDRNSQTDLNLLINWRTDQWTDRQSTDNKADRRHLVVTGFLSSRKLCCYSFHTPKWLFR